MRVVLEGGLYIVDAAHLILFAETHDDDSRNGIALCKNHHWAMDRNLIAPGADNAWHVLAALDDRDVGPELATLLGQPLGHPEQDKARSMVAASSGIAATVEFGRAYAAEAETALAGLRSRRLADALVSLTESLFDGQFQ